MAIDSLGEIEGSSITGSRTKSGFLCSVLGAASDYCTIRAIKQVKQGCSVWALLMQIIGYWISSRFLAVKSANDLQEVCSLHPSNLTKDSCSVNDINGFTSVVYASSSAA